MDTSNLIIILGATASGKTNLAVEVAASLEGEIISADSRQIFRHMDIGTGKDLHVYKNAGNPIPYHLIDILEPGQRYHVDAFKQDFFKAFEAISARGKWPILCGGTGLYIHSLLQHQPYTAIPVNETLRAELISATREDLIKKLDTYPPDLTRHVDRSSHKRLIRAIEIAIFLASNQLQVEERPTINPIVFGIKNEVGLTRARILKRLDERLASGMIEEVSHLIQIGVSRDMLVFYGLEYKFIVQYLDGMLSLEDLRTKLGIAICQYAKRQNTFFRKMEKDGVYIHWLNGNEGQNQLKQEILAKVLIKK